MEGTPDRVLSLACTRGRVGLRTAPAPGWLLSVSIVFVALVTTGCSKKYEPPQVTRAEAEQALVAAEAQARKIEESWPGMRNSVAESKIVPKRGEACPAKPRLEGLTTSILNAAMGERDGTSVLGHRIDAGDYYFTPPHEIAKAKSPKGLRLSRGIESLRTALDSEASLKTLSKKVQMLRRINPRYDALVVVDEATAPVLSKDKQQFTPGYAIGRAYLMDHDVGEVVCFASFAAENQGQVEILGGPASDRLAQPALESDLAFSVLRTVDERWMAAQTR